MHGLSLVSILDFSTNSYFGSKPVSCSYFVYRQSIDKELGSYKAEAHDGTDSHI